MAIYTYDDFIKAAQNSGYTFSDADMEMAKRNPDAGMSLIKYKDDYYAATTADARALAHQGAENIRGQYGGYTGGVDGGSFSVLNNYGAGNKPTYESRYDAQTQELMNAILNRKPFSYDAESDPLYQQYSKAYTREGQRATEDAIGAVAAASGGIPSSYAATAAAQAGNYYAAQKTDKIPELYQVAYDKYLNDYQQERNNLAMLENAEQIDYNKYLNNLGQYNTERNFGYAQMLDSLAREDQQRQEALNFANIAYGLGDTSYYKNMGIDMSNDPAAYERRYNEALLAMQLGDYSKVEEMFGIDTSNYSVEKQNQLAYALEVYTNTGDSSYLKALGIDMSKDPMAYQRAMDIYVRTGNKSYLEALGITVPATVVPGTVVPSTVVSELTRPDTLTTAAAWLKKYYGTDINEKEFKEIQAMYPDVTLQYLKNLGIHVDVSEKPILPNDLPTGNTVGNSITTETKTPAPTGTSVWTPDSATPGFDQSSVAIIEKKLGIKDLTAEKLNDLIDAGIVEHYVANNQDRFRLANNWETLWALYGKKPTYINSTGGSGGGRTQNVANVQK